MANAASVVVIGAGVAGLAAALSIARSGRTVTLLEATAWAGGCCSNTLSSGFTFNNGAVYAAVPSLLRSSFRRLGLNFDREVPMVPIEHPHLTRLDNGTVIRLSTVDTSTVEGERSEERTQMLRDGLGRLRERWSPVYRSLIEEVLPFEPSMLRALSRLWRYLPRMSGQVDALISSHFPDSDLQAAVASTLLYTGLPPQRLPATQIIGLLALLEEGFHLPRGGMSAIAGALQRELQKRLVAIRFNTRVTSILVEDGQVHGVGLADGEHIEARCVIATCSGFEVAHHLLPKAALPRQLAEKALRAPLSHRAISIQLGCSTNTSPDAFIVNHVPSMPEQGLMHTSKAGIPRWFAYTCPTQVIAEFAPPGKSVIELYAPATGIASASEWTKDMTDAVVTNFLTALRTRLPGLDIEVRRVLDPQDFARSHHLYEGALYGIAPGAKPDAFFPHRTHLRGLYLAGQTTFPGYGVPTAIVSGIQAAEASQHDAGRTSFD